MPKSHLLFLLAAALPSGALGQVSPSDASNLGGVVIPTANSGFEEPYRVVNSASDSPSDKGIIKGDVAEGWSDNSNWADVDVEFARETTDVHRGSSAQKITVNKVTSGAVQFVQTVPLHKDRIHLWKIWAKGRPGESISLSIRQAGTPYTTYAEQNAVLSAEWQEIRVFGAIPEETDGFLMVKATSPMKFWLDDSTLVDLSSASSNAQPKVGNLLAGGGSFEAGMPYGWSVRYEGEQGFQPKDPRPNIDASTAVVGKKSLRCDMPVGSSLRVSTPLIHFNYGRAHTVSFWAKSSSATSLNVDLGKALHSSFALTPEWKHYSVSGSLPFQLYTQLQFRVPQTSDANTVWLDGVQVEESAQPPSQYQPAEPVELSLQLAQPGHVLLQRETGTVTFQTAGDVPPNAKLKIAVEDLSGKNLSSSSTEIKSGRFTLPSMNFRFGIWKLRAQIVDLSGEILSAPYDLIWSRLPNPKTIEAKRSYFGLHLPLSQNYFDMARRIGVRRTRLHDTSMVAKWAIAEPKKDQFRYFDEGIDMAKKSGIEVLGMLDGAPGWTSTQPREGYWGIWSIPDQPGAAERWNNYVKHVVSHYEGRIDQWEIWNEPWGSWWANSGNPNATPEYYAELSRRAYKTAKAANPNVSILGISTYPGSAWTGQVLPLIKPENYDGFSFHEYNDAIFGGPHPIPQLRRTEFMDAQKKNGQPKPLWDTEGGLFGVGSWLAPETGGMPVALQPTYIVRYDVTEMAAGVKAFFLYASHTDPELGGMETVTGEYDRSIKPILAARAVLASLVDGLGVPVRSEPVRGVDLYTYPGGKVKVVWSYDGEKHKISIPNGFKARDVWGNDLKVQSQVQFGAEPIYLVKTA